MKIPVRMNGILLNFRDGLRYEISDFVSAMNGFEKSDYKLTAEESIAIAGIMEEFLTMRNSKGETEDEGL